MVKDLFYKYFLISLIGGIAGYFMLSSVNLYLFYHQAFYSQNFNQDQKPSVSITPMVTVSNAGWENLAQKNSLSSVGIQVFQNNRLIKQGNGLVVSSDGLVVTVADLALSGAIYQIFHEDKIIKATAEAVDFKLNLLLLKSQTSYASVADFDSIGNIKPGQDAVIIGKIVDLSRPILTVQRGLINYITEKAITIDAIPNNFLAGFGVINSNGRIIGIVSIKNARIVLIKSSLIKNFFENYLSWGENRF
ncbi:MAG: hypothetical protein A3F98_00060 [Candidatus Yanofskybacteria bacterium RIFCSPLOWO2_12_FULL_41_8]|nr:MAG: hypothetical protein A3F98_00060 [Candidatus Yanofskybacteria bacterium RIFCSPLOWO2_12_FULL_41_8]